VNLSVQISNRAGFEVFILLSQKEQFIVRSAVFKRIFDKIEKIIHNKM